MQDDRDDGRGNGWNLFVFYATVIGLCLLFWMFVLYLSLT
jgi:hypothetical protein